MPRVVIDPNVLISARLSPRGTPARLLAAWTDGRFELVISPALLAELSGVLQRPKFRRWLTPDEAHAFVHTLRTGASMIADPPARPGVTPDPGDDYLVTLARAAGADWLISGDAHLTALVDPEPPVLNPATFLAQFDG